MGKVGSSSIQSTHHVTALPDRDVVADFLGLVEATVPDPAEANRSPHWLTCELARAMFAYSSASRSLYKQKGQFRSFLAEIDRVVRGQIRFPDTNYLTNVQRKATVARYREDAQWLCSFAGVPLPPEEELADGKRPFLPSIERAPAAFFQLLEDRLGETDLRQRAPYIATTLETLLADKPGFPGLLLPAADNDSRMGIRPRIRP